MSALDDLLLKRYQDAAVEQPAEPSPEQPKESPSVPEAPLEGEPPIEPPPAPALDASKKVAMRAAETADNDNSADTINIASTECNVSDVACESVAV